MEAHQEADFQGTLVVSTNMSETDRIEKWFYGPIEEQGEHRGFTILFLILPIYERYLRHNHNYDEGDFLRSSDVITGIMNDFDITEDQAKNFWRIMRNGLLHRSAPKQTGSLTHYIIDQKVQPISESETGQLVVNPYAMRTLLLSIFRNNPAFWFHSGYPVPDEVTVAYQSPQPGETHMQTQPHLL